MAADARLDLFTDVDHGVLVTLKSDGRPQLSNVNHTFDPQRGLVRISITADRAKAKNLVRDPRASYHVTTADFGRWAVLEGIADLSPVAADPHDATVAELIDVYRAINGEHPDWEDYRAAMVADRRLVLRLPIDRVYGQV